MSPFTDALLDTRLVERNQIQMDEHQYDFIAQCFCLGYEIYFGWMREYRFKAETSAVFQQSHSHFRSYDGSIITMRFRRMRIKLFSQIIGIDKR